MSRRNDEVVPLVSSSRLHCDALSCISVRKSGLPELAVPEDPPGVSSSFRSDRKRESVRSLILTGLFLRQFELLPEPPARAGEFALQA